VIDGDQLVSAPISFFCSVLLSRVRDNWQKIARIVGETLASQMDDCLFQTGDIFLAARVNALAASGRLDIRGESALEMHHSEVKAIGRSIVIEAGGPQPRRTSLHTDASKVRRTFRRQT
jgi:Protein of unknown function